MNELKHIKNIYPNGKQYCGDCKSFNVDGLLCHNCNDYPMIMKVKDKTKIHIYECDAGRNQSYHIKTKLNKIKTGASNMTNAMKPKLGDYSESLVDTPFNREVQERLDYWNAKISKVTKDYKLFGFQQDKNTSKTVEILAMATKHCPKRLIGGNAKGFLSRHEKYPEGMISNYIGIGLNGEIAVGYKYLLEDLDDYMEQVMQNHKLSDDDWEAIRFAVDYNKGTIPWTYRITSKPIPNGGK